MKSPGFPSSDASSPKKPASEQPKAPLREVLEKLLGAAQDAEASLQVLESAAREGLGDAEYERVTARLAEALKTHRDLACETGASQVLVAGAQAAPMDLLAGLPMMDLLASEEPWWARSGKTPEQLWAKITEDQDRGPWTADRLFSASTYDQVAWVRERTGAASIGPKWREGVRTVMGILSEHTDKSVRSATATYFGRLDGKKFDEVDPAVANEAVARLSVLAGDATAEVRQAACRALGKHDRPDALRVLLGTPGVGLRDRDTQIRSEALEALGGHSSGEAETVLKMVGFHSDKPSERVAVAKALGKRKEPWAVELLTRLASDADPNVSAASEHAVLKMPCSLHGKAEILSARLDAMLLREANKNSAWSSVPGTGYLQLSRSYKELVSRAMAMPADSHHALLDGKIHDDLSRFLQKTWQEGHRAGFTDGPRTELLAAMDMAYGPAIALWDIASDFEQIPTRAYVAGHDKYPARDNTRGVDYFMTGRDRLLRVLNTAEAVPFLADRPEFGTLTWGRFKPLQEAIRELGEAIVMEKAALMSRRLLVHYGHPTDHPDFDAFHGRSVEASRKVIQALRLPLPFSPEPKGQEVRP